MPNFSPLKYAQALMGASPSEGGLNYADYPHPYQTPYAKGGGLRMWEDAQGNLQGQAMPKTSGWMGEIPAMSGKDRKITEFSLGGENGEPMLPMVFEGMTPYQIETVKMLEANKLNRNSPRGQQAFKDAINAAKIRMQQNLSPFKDYN